MEDEKRYFVSYELWWKDTRKSYFFNEEIIYPKISGIEDIRRIEEFLKEKNTEEFDENIIVRILYYKEFE